MTKKYKVWTCKIAISDEHELPNGFDAPPRQAAERAIAAAGFDVLMNSSGWGGSLTKADIEYLEDCERNGRQENYFAGAMDADDTAAH